MGCTSAKPDIKSQANSLVHNDHTLEPHSENGSFAYDYAAPASVVAYQGFAPKANTLDSRWQLHPNPHTTSRIRRVNVAVDTAVTPTMSPQLTYGTPFDYKPPLTAMTADSKHSYFMYAESSAPDIRAPREEAGSPEEGHEGAQEDCYPLDECSTSTGDNAPINLSGSHRTKALNATLTGSRRLDETWLEFHNAGRSEADATDIQEERIHEALLESRDKEIEEATRLKSTDDLKSDSHHTHELVKSHHDHPTIPHSSSGKLTTAGNALQSQEDLAQSPVHRNLNTLLMAGKESSNVKVVSDFPFIQITQPAPFLSKTRHESVRDWLVHIDLTKQKEPVSPQGPIAAPAFVSFTDVDTHHSVPSESEPPVITKKISGNTLSSFRNIRNCSIEGMTDDTATNRSSPSTVVPTLVN